MASYGIEGSGKRRFCSQHAEDGMVSLCAKTCTRRGCARIATFGVHGTGRVEACAEHAGESMVDCPQLRCSHTGCPIMQATRGTGGAAKFFLCAKHLGRRGRRPQVPVAVPMGLLGMRKVGREAMRAQTVRRASFAAEPNVTSAGRPL